MKAMPTVTKATAFQRRPGTKLKEIEVPPGQRAEPVQPPFVLAVFDEGRPNPAPGE